MKTYLLNLWDTVRTSYWFVPSLFALGAVLLSLFLPRLDAMVLEAEWGLPEGIITTTQTARATLSAIAGAMVAVTGTVFSITIVTLSLTSQQYGPRLLRRFMHDLPTQITLGVFLSTGFYCLLVLRVVEHHEGGLIAPHLSVLMAVVLAVLSMAMLILFIHHVAILIQAPHVVAAVAHDLDDAILRLFPEKIGESAEEVDLETRRARHQVARLGDPVFVGRSTQEGYIQAINGMGLLDLACERDLVLRLCSRPGQFITHESRLAEVWPASDPQSTKLNENELTVLLNEMIIVGLRSTPRQDVQCAINELVEVAVRSLSPGINDPFTAMNCIDRLGAALARLAERELPKAYRYDGEGRLRLIAQPVSFAEMMDAAFNQIRQYGQGSVAVIIRLLEALGSIAERLRRREDREAVKRHAEMVSRLGKALPESHDRKAVQERWERMMKLLDHAGAESLATT